MNLKETVNKPWLMTKEQVITALTTNPDEGLTQQEVNKRLNQFGQNELPKKETVSVFAIFIRQVNNIFTLVLLVTLIIAALAGKTIDAISIAVILVLNIFIGFFQEYTAEKSLAALKKMERSTANAIRNGEKKEIPASQLVPGDIVILQAGDKIPADGRIIDEAELATQEAALTGESLPIEKTDEPLVRECPLAERINMAYMGTIIVDGNGKMVVTATGTQTELGAVSTLIQEEQQRDDRELTPLQVRIQQLGRRLVGISLIFVIIIFLLQFFRQQTIFNALLAALSLAISAIPEGLPAVMTITLALGVKRMAKRHILIRKLPSVETLGSVSVICSDKTGTLTKNEMTATDIWLYNNSFSVSGVGYNPKGEFKQNHIKINPQNNNDLMQLLNIGLLCNNTTIDHNNVNYTVIGDPTEGALVTLAAKTGLNQDAIEDANPLIEELPFDSERERMSMLRKTDHGNILYVKGSPYTILELSTYILINNEVVPLTQEHKAAIQEANNDLMNQALRVLAFAYKKTDQTENVDERIEHDLVFVGLIGMIDPPRQEVKKAIKTCENAGIRVVMITGDQKGTGIAIARELGLLKEDSIAVTDTELDQMDDQELAEKLPKIAVYARVSPKQKIRIVRFWRKRGDIVAVTGDGVNDAPAIKAADIGIAMGITGTDVAKEASDMIITDDNFASIVEAVREGRGIYDNITKFINYLISSNVAELFIIFIGVLVGFTGESNSAFIPLLPIHLLWINLLTDGFPALALAVEPFSRSLMERAPRDPATPILTKSILIQILYMGILITAATLTACYLTLQLHPTNIRLAHTVTLTTIVMLELARIYIIRRQSNTPFFTNYWLGLAIIVSLSLQLLVLYVPWLQVFFKTAPLNFTQWSMIIGLTAATFMASVITQSIVNKFLPSEK